MLRGGKLFVDINKCTFKQQERIYLRLCWKQNGLSIKFGKISTIIDWIPLNNIHHLLYFMRLVNYLREFIMHLSYVARPLNKLDHNYVSIGGSCNESIHIDKTLDSDCYFPHVD